MKALIHGYAIDFDKIADLSSLGGYWDDVYEFLSDIDTKDNITEGQTNWLKKISTTHEDQWEKDHSVCKEVKI